MSMEEADFRRILREELGGKVRTGVSPLTLGELIKKLQARPQTDKIHFDVLNLVPTTFDSWRGDYSQLALGFDGSYASRYSTVAELLKHCSDTHGTTITGWKGGDYDVHDRMSVWVANRGNVGETCVVDVIANPRWDEGYSLIVTGICEP